MIISEKLRTKSQILYDLPFRSNDVERILNLPSGYFDEDFGQLKQFPKVRDEHKQRTFEDGGGKVIKYKFG